MTTIAYTIRVMDGTPAEGGSVWNYSPTITAKSTDEALDAVEAGNRAVRTLSYEAA